MIKKLRENTKNQSARKKKRHFLFFRKLFPDAGWGGTEVVLRDWLSQIDYQQCRVTLAVPKGSKEIFSRHCNASVNIVEYNFPLSNKAWINFRSMLKFFSQIKPSTVIFVNGWYTDFSLFEVLAAFLVTTGHVFIHENVGPDIPTPKTSRKHFGFIPGIAFWWHKTAFFVYSKAYFCKKVLFVSKTIHKTFVDLWEYPKHNALVMYHGTNLSKYYPSPETRKKTREMLNFSETDVIIIATARLAKFKCLDRLINAFDVLNRDFGNLHLLLAGTGPLEIELKKLAAGKVSRDRIKFLGHVSNISDLLQSSDIYVLSSDNEGLSLALLEAMASGLICISTRCPGSPEVIEDGVNGFLVETNTQGVEQALRKTLGLSSSQKNSIKDEAQKTIREKFNIQSNVKKVLNIFGISSVE